jgi:hypothetical protein
MAASLLSLAAKSPDAMRTSFVVVASNRCFAGHTKLDTVRYLGIEVDDALNIAEQIEL